MEEMGEFSSTLFLQGEPIRNLQSPIIHPDIPIQDFSIDARFATLLTGRSTAFQEHLHGSMIQPLAIYEQLDGSSCKWDFNGFDPIANMNLDRYNRESTISFNNELSLSLATSRPSIPYHRSTVQFPPLGSGSRYLTVVQEILTRVASYSLENFDPVSYVAQVDGSDAFGWNVQEGGYNMVPMVRGRRKEQLLALLQAVDDQYNQCSDEIHTVISAFHAATELDPKIHGKFALQTMSMLYKNLRERISNCILSMGEDSMEQEQGRAGRDLERRWNLQQQLKKKEHLQHHHLWRVQRGLPEKSVSVLRTWMFDNFLHPYPKDAEKHLLSIKSGLSRSQVSNWFINARVRLWKPMIEEMYAEMNRRKGIAITRELEEGSCLNHTHKNCITF